MENTRKLYIGVSGVTTPEETDQLLEVYDRVGFPLTTGHRPRLTFLVNSDGVRNPERRVGPRYARVSDLPEMLAMCKDRALGVVAFHAREADYFSKPALGLISCVPGLENIQFQITTNRNGENH